MFLHLVAAAFAKQLSEFPVTFGTSFGGQTVADANSFLLAGVTKPANARGLAIGVLFHKLSGLAQTATITSMSCSFGGVAMTRRDTRGNQLNAAHFGPPMLALFTLEDLDVIPASGDVAFNVAMTSAGNNVWASMALAGAFVIADALVASSLLDQDAPATQAASIGQAFTTEDLSCVLGFTGAVQGGTLTADGDYTLRENRQAAGDAGVACRLIMETKDVTSGGADTRDTPSSITTFLAASTIGFISTGPPASFSIQPGFIAATGGAFTPEIEVDDGSLKIDPDFIAATGGAFSPTVVNLFAKSSLQLHLHASFNVTDNGGGAVSPWGDRSANAFTFAQATSGRRPLIGTINTNPGIQFDGIDDFLRDNTAATLPISPGSFLVVYTPTTITGTSNLAFRFRNNTTFENILDFVRNDDDMTAFLRAATGSNLSLVVSNEMVANETRWAIARMRASGDGNSDLLTSDGGTDSDTGPTTLLASADDLLIGGNANATSLWTGYIHEIVVFNEFLSDADRTALADLANAEWTIA